MRIIKNPKIKEWQELSVRPEIEKDELDNLVGNILNDVKNNKDKALFRYTEQFDNVKSGQIEVTVSEIATANNLVSVELKAAIENAKQNIEKFHASQKIEEQVIGILKLEWLKY